MAREGDFPKAAIEPHPADDVSSDATDEVVDACSSEIEENISDIPRFENVPHAEDESSSEEAHQASADAAHECAEGAESSTVAAGHSDDSEGADAAVETTISDAPPSPSDRVGPDVTQPRLALTPWQRLTIAMRPRLTRAQLLTALLLGILGFALVVQLQLSQKDELAGLRQAELVNLLDEVTRRTDDLESEERRLNTLLAELESGRNTQEVARKAAEESAIVQGILSGRLPATGPGVRIDITEGDQPLRAQVLFNVLEELRNAGAEAVEVNGVRLVASSYFAEEDGQVTVGGVRIESPYTWFAIGDPDTIQPALEIPGGAMPSVRSSSGYAQVTSLGEVTVSAVVDVKSPRYAEPDEAGQ